MKCILMRAEDNHVIGNYSNRAMEPTVYPDRATAEQKATELLKKAPGHTWLVLEQVAALSAVVEIKREKVDA